jgi:hypothetical protein
MTNYLELLHFFNPRAKGCFRNDLFRSLEILDVSAKEKQAFFIKQHITRSEN